MIVVFLRLLYPELDSIIRHLARNGMNGFFMSGWTLNDIAGGGGRFPSSKWCQKEDIWVVFFGGGGASARHWDENVQSKHGRTQTRWTHGRSLNQYSSLLAWERLQKALSRVFPTNAARTLNPSLHKRVIWPVQTHIVVGAAQKSSKHKRFMKNSNLCWNVPSHQTATKMGCSTL